MERASKQGWQVGKSLAECNQYMLDQEIACDVTFNVHPSDGSTQLVKAHRYMLIARSPVFETMLCGTFKEATSAVIDIKDIEPHIFKDILRFVYTGEVAITADNVLPLKHAADLYIMEPLVQQCIIFLENSLRVENAAVILTHSLVFGEKDLIEKTLNVIRGQTKDFLKSDSFLQLSHSALEMFLKTDEMTIDGEEQVCQATVKWARHRCGGGNPDLQQIRDTLGDCLKQIRFGYMQPEQFNQCVGSTLLTDQEFRSFHLTFYAKISDHKSRSELQNNGFNLTSRKPKDGQHIVNRFSAANMPTNMSRLFSTDVISFETNRAIKLIGISLYGAQVKGSLVAYVLYLIPKDAPSWTQLKSGQLISTGTPDLIPLMLETPISLKSNAIHTLMIYLSGGVTFRGVLGKVQVICGGVIFTFSNNLYHESSTDVNQGQIPGLIFTPI